MPNSLTHRSISLKTAETSIETPSVDIIVAGGPSSSALLNNLKGAVTHDLVELERRVEENARQISLANRIFQVQLDALQARFGALATRLPSASGLLLVDFYTGDFIGAGNSAEISLEYGQATLPILSSQEQLVATDTAGNLWIPPGAQLMYAYQDAAPQETEWLPDADGRFALDQRPDTSWWRARETSGSVWVRVRVPANLSTNRLSNCIVLHPYPTLYSDVLSVEYRDPAGVWTAADLSYLTGWSSDVGRVQWAGNLRLWIPNSQVVELRIHLITPALWGFSQIALREIAFAPTATLVADYAAYVPGTIGSPVLFGKDPATLSYLATAVSGNRVSTFLTQQSANASPIIGSVQVTNA